MPTAPKRAPRVGDKAWEVDLCLSVPRNEFGDADLDNAVFRYELHDTREQALERARELLPQDYFGEVAVTPVEFVPYHEDNAEMYPHAGYWQASGETVYVEKD